MDVQFERLSFASKASNLNVELNFCKNFDDVTVANTDSLVVIGKSKDLKKIQISHVASVLTRLEISEKWFSESVQYLTNKKITDEKGTSLSPSASVSWLNKMTIHCIPGVCSRNNTPSKAHAVAKAVKGSSFSKNQLILIAAEKKNTVALAAAVSRVFPLYSAKTSEKTSAPRTVNVSFLFTDESTNIATEDDLECYKVLSRSVRLSCKITDMPCNYMNTDDFLNEVKLVGKELGIEPFVIEGEDLRTKGFGGIYSVGKAAVNSPKLVVLSNIKPTAKRTIAWVGKGIVYDTGGLCIKSRVGMCGMKVDCGGAAAVLGAFYTAVQLGFEDNLHAIFCLAENAVAANAYRPDDVITLYSGKTVEITNTDAEGRVVLGDGVAYASKDLKADIIVDIATLTGAQGAATGIHHAAVLCNNQKWETACVDSGKKSGDLCHPIIFCPEFHFGEFKSEIADMTNSVSADNARSSCAGLFIHSHLASNFDGIWVHVDMAAPVMDGNRSTGYGVALLNSIFSDSISNPLFRSLAPAGSLPVKNESTSELED